MIQSKMRAASLAGLAMGAASATPGLGALNCACCSLILLGGFLAAYLYFKDAPPSPQPAWGDAAVLGLLAGLMGAGVTAMLSLPIALLGWGAGMWSSLQGMLGDADLPPQLRTLLATVGTSTFAITAVLLSFVFNLFIYGLFSTIGALLGAAVLYRKPGAPLPAAEVPPAPPPPPPPPAPVV